MIRIHHALKVSFALTLVLGSAALADRPITVDGSISDWDTTSTKSCLTGPFGAGGGGMVVDKVCVENDNTATNGGYLYVLEISTAAAPTTSTNLYWGFQLDSAKSGTLTANSDIWAAYFPAGAGSATALTRTTLTNFATNTPGTNYVSTSTCGAAPGTSDGWSAVKNGANIELRIAYGCLQMAHCDDSRLMTIGNYDMTARVASLSPQVFFNGSSDTLPALLNLPYSATNVEPDPNSVTASGTNGSVKVQWNNPQAHEGAVLLHSTSPIPSSTTLTNGTTYSAGTVISPGVTVAYADYSTCGASFTETLPNGTPEYYRLYNSDQVHKYSKSTAAPSSSGLMAFPSSGASGTPLDCYSVGLTNLQQPTVLRGVGVYSSGNGTEVVGVQTAPGASADGQELWRPTAINGSSQSRSPIVPLAVGGSSYLLTGDQAGYAHVFDARTGLPTWSAVFLGAPILAQPAAQLNAYADAAFKAAFPGQDLVFYATSGATDGGNAVYARNSLDGGAAWTYRPGGLGDVNGGMLVDYTNDRLWVGAHKLGSGSNLRILNSLTGAQVAAINLVGVDGGTAEDVDFGINEDFRSKTVYVISTQGMVWGLDLSSQKVLWSYQLPAGSASSYPYVTGSGFLVSDGAGAAAAVERYSVYPKDGGVDAGYAITQLWSTKISSPSGVTVGFVPSVNIFVGSSDSKVHELDPNTGADLKQVTLTPSTIVGTPALDPDAGRLTVGTMDGRLCTFAQPF